MAKYRAVARTVYEEHSEPIEAASPEEALKKAQTYYDVDNNITPMFVRHEDIVEIYDDESEESPPPTWLVGDYGVLTKI